MKPRVFAPDSTVCFCHAVTCGEIQEAIRNGAHSVYEIQLETQASTGCGGCEWDVREILEQALNPGSAPASDSST